MRLKHPFEPVWSSDARVLILGTFPSVGSVAGGGYYGNPRNHFWSLMSETLDEWLDVGVGWETRYRVLKERRIALWDVVKECDRDGPSSDADLRNVVPNDVLGLAAKMGGLRTIAFTGRTAARLFFQAYPSRMGEWIVGRSTESLVGMGMDSIHLATLPSPSPANATPYVRKLAAYRAAVVVA